MIMSPICKTSIGRLVYRNRNLLLPASSSSSLPKLTRSNVTTSSSNNDDNTSNRSSKNDGIRYLSSSPASAYNTNRNIGAYQQHQQQHMTNVEWSMYHNKIPILQSDDKVPVQEREEYYGYTPRTSVLMELTDRVGILHDVLRYFWKYDINISRIESRPMVVDVNNNATTATTKKKFDFFIDFDGSLSDTNVRKLLDALEPMTDKLLVLDEKEVHWFPRHISELDCIADRTLDAGVDLESDHPGFNDQEYRRRRAILTENAKKHRWNAPIQRIDYSQEEIQTWATVWDRMEPLWEKYACKEYLDSLQLMKQNCGYSRTTIPQQEDISNFLYSHSRFRMRPVAGLLSSRDFLNGLAFRVFFSTQYIRHHSKPLYTPEPDICHELLGHAPMFANRDFADFSQEIGLASLGASDDDIAKLAHCYWHSVEFGLCEEESTSSSSSSSSAYKAYGAGLLSSFGELEYSCSGTGKGGDIVPEIKPWDPEVAAHQEFPITTYQPVYFLASSLQDAKQQMRKFCEGLARPFFAMHNRQNDTIHIDRPVKRTRGVPSINGGNE